MTNEQRKEKEEELKNLTQMALESGMLSIENLERLKENLNKKSA